MYRCRSGQNNVCSQSLSTCTEYKSFRTGASWCFIITGGEVQEEGIVQTYLVAWAIGAVTEITPGYLKERQKAKKARRVVIVLSVKEASRRKSS